MIENIAAKLDYVLRKVVPEVVGVSLGRRDDRSTWTVVWPKKYEPSSEQRKLVEQVIESFDATVVKLEEETPSSELTLEERVARLEKRMGIN